MIEVRFQKYSGSLEFECEYGLFKIMWGGWLYHERHFHGTEDSLNTRFATIIGPLIEHKILSIQKENDLYVLTFDSGQNLYAGRWPAELGTDFILMIRAENPEAPITWGLLD
ncbi:hypothetical protein [Brevundimonas sp.]|uniref:hypothetical protein n=1 Tax=Brevundimonas sp. TaxID=1871086 RepID=UPI002AC9D54B|nr:hypothetical protein [Brevundimonas sp.]